MRLSPRRVAVVATLVVATVVGLPAVGGAGPLDQAATYDAANVRAALDPALTGAVVAAAGGATIGYATKVVVITQGSSLTFVNLDQLAHTVTSVQTDQDGKPLFVGNALPGSTSTIAGVEKLAPGTYTFYCQFHPNMTGTLIVEGSGGGVKPAAPSYSLPLRIPRVLTAANITIPVKQADVRMLPKGPATTLWTYGGSYPGPTIRRPAGALTRVTFVNQLDDTVGSVTVHFHGDHHASADDGQPASQLIAPGRRRTYTFPLKEEGRPERGMFDFYHDHRMDVTGRNVWNGLQGMFIVDDPRERTLGLPSGAYDVPLLVSDRSFTDSNQLTEPFPHAADGQDKVTDKFTGAYAPPGDATVGNRILVNGEYAPHFDVGTHRYRLRILNGSSFESYDFHLTNGQPFLQVGTGAGLLPAPVSRTDILLGPAERADVVVDFTHQAGKRIVLESIARSDNRPGGIGTPTAPLMQFRVARRVRDTSRVPRALRPLPPLAVPAVPTMTWTFGLGGDAQRGTYWAVNGRPFDPSRIDATVPLGSVQRWMLVNLSPITHYIHLHEMSWRTISRDGRPPAAYEAGFEDTWRLDPGETVEVAAKMTDYTGNFMIHCHMLDHEDHGMMATFQVVKSGSTSTLPPVPLHAADATAVGHAMPSTYDDPAAASPAGPAARPTVAGAVTRPGTRLAAWHATAAIGAPVLLALLGLLMFTTTGRRRVEEE